MRIAVAGGTGTLGVPVVEELRRLGDEVRVLSRRSAKFPVDLTTGAGLDEAVAGCEVVIDASNNSSPRGAKATLVDGTQRLLDAARAAGLQHVVSISIVGCERAPMSYYKVKSEQERLVAEGSVPWSIVRATQFHELVAWAFAAAARRAASGRRALLVPVAMPGRLGRALRDGALTNERPDARGAITFGDWLRSVPSIARNG
jgi:uncharacterized protein YbjT (DUF2867 family)